MPLSRWLAITFAIGLWLIGPGRASAQDYWLLSTEAAVQELGTDPVFRAFRLDSRGHLSKRDPDEILDRSVGRPVIFLIHGSYVTLKRAITEGLRIRDDLIAGDAITPDALIVELHWPSELADAHLVRDANDKARRAFVAGYHLARFLERFPAGTRSTLVGHSHGGIVVLGALQLLAGGTLDNGEEATVLSKKDRSRLRLRAVLIASASDHHWLIPGERFGRSLSACEAMLCLYNRLDPVLVVHPFGEYSEGEAALGSSGLSCREREQLGPLQRRYYQRNIALLLGPRHTFRGSMANPGIGDWIGPYTSWSDAG